ncbi:alpha/beta hydrolase [Parafrankia discariae]|uniref:alpha/beta hydrolase n=1 Tax=Parafrankia discariae TaxID=365528 RepID=UPI00037686A2|nr:alpha/beta hydrolase [Parafrankia discariae]
MSGAPGRRTWENDRELRDRAYSPSLTVPDMAGFLREYAARSDAARRSIAWREIAYGPTAAETLHLFPARRDHAPLQVFVHGGYWQELSRWESSFAAPDFVARGAAFAALGYGLAPAHRLDEIVAQVRRGVHWLFRHAGELGVDPTRVFLSGSSAGAHLVAMCLLDGWLPAPLRPRDVIRGATLLSGIYDLEPLRDTYVGEAIGLTAAEAARNSPLRRAGSRLPPLVVARGERETVAFAAQHSAFTTSLAGTGTPVTALVAAGRHHFDLPFDLGDPATLLGRATLTRMGLAVRLPADGR